MCFMPGAYGQAHQSAWVRGTASFTLTPKLQVDGELQHRRQNGYDNKNMLDKNLMFTFRSWIHYRAGKTIKLSVSPFAVFSNYAIIRNPGDEFISPTTEIRFTGAMETEHKLYKKFSLAERPSVEYRVFETGNPMMRLRQRVKVRYEINPRLMVGAFEEILLRTNNTAANQLLDHNRIGIDAAYTLAPGHNITTGYMHIARTQATSAALIKEDVVFINLTVTPNKWARSAKKHNP